MVKRFLLIPLMVVLAGALIFGGCAAPAPAPAPVAPALGPTPSPVPGPAAPAPAPVPAPKVFQWRGQFPFASEDITTKINLQKAFDAMEKASEGRLVIERHPVDALVSIDGMFDAVSSGALDIAPTVTAYYSGKLPPGLGDVTALPLAWTNPQDYYNIWYKEGLLEILQKAYAAHNIAVIGTAGASRYGLETTFPVHKLEDLKGKRIRGVGAYLDLIKKAGGAPVYVPGPEIYMAMKLGTIDAFIWGFSDLEYAGHKEIVDYVTFPPFSYPPPCEFLVNMDSWKALPTDLQDALVKALEEVVVPLTEEIGALDMAMFERCRDEVEVITLADAEVARFREVSMGIGDELAAESPEAAAAIKILKDYYKMP